MLSEVDNLVFNYKLSRGSWNMDLAEAIGELKGSGSLATRQPGELTWITSPAGVMPWHANLECINFCGACLACLSDEQVTRLAAFQC